MATHSENRRWSRKVVRRRIQAQQDKRTAKQRREQLRAKWRAKLALDSPRPDPVNGNVWLSRCVTDDPVWWKMPAAACKLYTQELAATTWKPTDEAEAECARLPGRSYLLLGQYGTLRNLKRRTGLSRTAIEDGELVLELVGLVFRRPAWVRTVHGRTKVNFRLVYATIDPRRPTPTAEEWERAMASVKHKAKLASFIRWVEDDEEGTTAAARPEVTTMPRPTAARNKRDWRNDYERFRFR